MPAHGREVFELPDFEGVELEVWALEAQTGHYVAVRCVRQFLSGVGQLVIDDTMSRGPCTQRSPTRDG